MNNSRASIMFAYRADGRQSREAQIVMMNRLGLDPRGHGPGLNELYRSKL